MKVIYSTPESSAEALHFALESMKAGELVQIRINDNALEAAGFSKQAIMQLRFAGVFGSMIMRCMDAGLTPDEYTIVAKRFFRDFPKEVKSLYPDFGVMPTPEDLARAFVQLAQALEASPELREIVEATAADSD